MEIKRYPISSLKGAKYNPKQRTSAKGVRQLVHSFERVGLLQPILITKDLRIIDGHRRCSAAVALRWKDIPCLITEAESVEEVYAEVNATAKRHTGNQTLQIYLRSPIAVTGAARHRCLAAEELLGRPLLLRMAAGGFSLVTLRRAREIADFVALAEDVAFIRRALVWLMKHHNQGIIHAYIQMRQPPKALHEAIMAGRDLRVAYK